MHIYLYVPDVDALFAQAIAAGAREVMPVTDQATASDPAASSIRSATCGGSRPTPEGASSPW